MPALGFMLGTANCRSVTGEVSAPPPEVPGNFVVDSRTAASLTVTWNALPEGVTARVQWQSPEFPEWAEMEGATLPFVVAGLEANKVYDVRIRAESAGQFSDWVTLEDEFTRPAAPTVFLAIGRPESPPDYGLCRLYFDLGAGEGTTCNLYANDVLLVSGITETPYTVDTGQPGQLLRFSARAVSNTSGLESDALDSFGTTGAGTTPTNDSPPNLDPPDTVFLSSEVSVIPGVWAGDPPPTFKYQWFANDSPVTGEMEATSIPVFAHFVEGDSIYCREIASNEVGFEFAVTGPTMVISDPPPDDPPEDPPV